MIQRMIGAALFNAETYEEIEADPSAIGQAILVVLLVTLCGAVGGIIGASAGRCASASEDSYWRVIAGLGVRNRPLGNLGFGAQPW